MNTSQDRPTPTQRLAAGRDRGRREVEALAPPRDPYAGMTVIGAPLGDQRAAGDGKPVEPPLPAAEGPFKGVAAGDAA